MTIIQMIKRLTKVPILGIIDKIPDIENTDNIMRRIFKESVKIEDLLNCMDEI